MTTLRSKFIAGSAALALAALGLTACGSDDPKERPGASESTESTEQAPSDETDAPESPEDTDAPEETEAPAPPANTGDLTQENFAERTTNAQMAAGSTYMVQTTEGMGIKQVSEGSIVYSENLNEMIMEMNSSIEGVGDQQTLLINGEMYMKMPALTGDKWVRIDGSEPGMAGMDELVEQADPQEQMDALDSAIKEFRAEANAETIDGVPTTKITLVLDTASYLDPESIEMIGDTVTLIYFVGPDDLPRRQISQTGDITVTTDFSRWGEPVNVTAPSPDEITTFEEIMQP